MREDEERDRKMLLTPDGHGKVDKALALNRLLNAARRAGAEEMRESADAALRDMMATTPPPDGCQCGGCVYIGEARKVVAAALNPDAKGGEHAPPPQAAT